MAKKIFKADLSVSGIEKLKKQLIQYRDKELREKCRLLSEKLLDIGIEVAKTSIEESPLGSYISLETKTDKDKNGCRSILIATGEIKEADEYSPFSTLLAVEYGAGIYYNPIANPNADEFGFGVGTFPGQLHAFEEGWIYWDDSLMEWRYTHGVKATMPMYNASMEMNNKIKEVIKEVFK